MLHTIKHKISTLDSELGYRLKLWQHKQSLPTLEASDRLIVNTLQKEGVYITTLEELGLISTPDLLKAAHIELAQMSAVSNQNIAKRLPQIYTVTNL